MRRVGLWLGLAVGAGFAQQTVVTVDSTGNRVAPGDVTNLALRVVCVNPVSHALESCAGGGGAGTNVTITQGGNDAIVDATGALKVLATVDTTGLATSALQTTGNNSLSSLDGKAPALGQALAAASLPVVLTAAQVATLTPPAAITGFATESTLSTLNGKIPSLVSGRTPVDGSGVTQPVSGTFWQATQPVSGPLTDTQLRATPVPVSGTVTSNAGTGTFTVGQATGTNLHMVCDSGCTPGGSTSDNSAFTFGTTALNPAGFVFDDAAPNAVTENNVATPRMAANRVPYSTIRDAAGNERGANVTAGNALLVDASATTQPISGTVTVTDGAGALNVIVDSGSLTANAGTNLNTSLLALESGGNLATIVTNTGRIPAQGQALAAASLPVVLTAAQMTTLTPLSSVTVTQGTGTNLHVVCDSGCTPGGSFADNAAFTFGTTAINTAGYVVDDTGPNAATENSAAAPRMSTNRVPYGIIRDGELNERAAYVTAGNALKVDASATTQPISGTVTVTDGAGALNVIVDSSALPSGASTLAEQQTQTTALQLLDDTVGATAAAIPAKGIGALGTDGTNGRILKTDTGGELQVDVLTLPTLAAVTTVSTVTSLTQMNGQAIAMGTGARSAGTQRVTIATDDVVPVSQSGSWTLAANQSTNVAQINGVTPLMGTGNTGTGSLRVTLATDQAAIATMGNGATGAAPPVNAQLQGGLGSGATSGLMIAPTVCDQWVAINGTASADLVTGVSGRRIYICSGNIQMNGGANTISFVGGTGTVCATSIEAVPGFDGATSAANGYSFAANSGMTWAGANGAAFARTTTTGENLCILIGSATRVVGGFSYAIY